MVDFAENSETVHISEFPRLLDRGWAWITSMRENHEDVKEALVDANQAIGRRLYCRALKKEYDGRLFAKWSAYYFRDMRDYQEDQLSFKARLGNLLQQESGQKAETLLAKLDALAEAEANEEEDDRLD